MQGGGDLGLIIGTEREEQTWAVRSAMKNIAKSNPRMEKAGSGTERCLSTSKGSVLLDARHGSGPEGRRGEGRAAMRRGEGCRR